MVANMQGPGASAVPSKLGGCGWRKPMLDVPEEALRKLKHAGAPFSNIRVPNGEEGMCRKRSSDAKHPTR